MLQSWREHERHVVCDICRMHTIMMLHGITKRDPSVSIVLTTIANIGEK